VAKAIIYYPLQINFNKQHQTKWKKPSYYNQLLLALIVDTNKKKQCQQTPANFFMNVPTARQDLNPKKAIVVCFAAMVQ
jgi:hypothetical protein